MEKRKRKPSSKRKHNIKSKIQKHMHEDYKHEKFKKNKQYLAKWNLNSHFKLH